MSAPWPTLAISPRAAQQISEGYLWIFSNELVRQQLFLEPGTWCHFSCQGQPIASGYYNPHSLIAGRVVSRENEPSLEALLERRLKAAFERRRDVIKAGSARLVFSEADFLPGLILDFYSGILVLQSNTAGIDKILPQLQGLIPQVFAVVFQQALTGFVIHGDSAIRQLEKISEHHSVVLGTAEQLQQSQFQENGVTYAADFMNGQKTGFFLDQRDNRSYLAQLVSERPGMKILDLCSYSGGWGLRALVAGAASVMFVDQSAEALALVRRGLELNGIPESKATLVQSDVFDFLEKDLHTFDIVVADPPAFVKSKKVLPQAMKAYEKLNRLAWRRLKRDGLLLTCSCSYHITDGEFKGLVSSAVSREKADAHMVYRGGQATDHPILLSMPETNYLKCLGIRKL